MTTHLSVRLAWHDRGWDGCVCDAPQLNASCIVHQHIREQRDDVREEQAAGIPLADLGGWLPPCSRDTGAFARRGYETTHHDPLEFRSLLPVPETIPGYSCCPSPYRWMREENFRDVCNAEGLAIRGPDRPKQAGWVTEADRQRELLRHFWKKVEAGRSLIFFYCNHGNPLDESTPRVIVGVGRVKEMGPQLYFGSRPGYADQYPVWSRRITQDYPDQGVRLPYQEYLRGGHPLEGIICRVPNSALPDFSYVGEHVSDDVAVSILERIIQSVERVRAEGRVPGDWDGRLAWLNEALDDTWTGRGAYPGIGSVLQYLGCEKGAAFHRLVLAPMARRGEDPWKHVTAILDGRAEPTHPEYRTGLLRAREQWSKLRNRHRLLSTLVRFELSPEQVERISNPDLRVRSGIDASESEIVANPYLLAESDFGTLKSPPIGLEAIDHGMLPEGDAALFPGDDFVAHDDRRRVRAVTHAVLSDAASNGDTVLPLSEALQRVTERFPDQRACRPDRDIFIADAPFHEPILWMAVDDDPQLVALRTLREMEQYIGVTIARRAKKVAPPSPTAPDWRAALEAVFGPPANEREEAAFAEKEVALGTLLSRRLSVLTGGAGTGKTSVLKVFLDELERLEGRKPVLLLAPTGKARVRLSTRTQRNAMTIHQFLLKAGWLVPGLFALRAQSDRDTWKATTVVVDECSMIPADLFATLLRALDMGPLARIVLVGDPNQLPPIGPGRPFIDILRYLDDEQPACLAPLEVAMRTNPGSAATSQGSVALTLAEGYRAGKPVPGDDEILSAIAKGQSHGDLDVVFWNSHDELIAKLERKVCELAGFRPGDYVGFNASLGLDTKSGEKVEDWQGLSPTRTQPFGTEDLNRFLQRKYKGGLIRTANQPRSSMPRPFGDQEIVSTDKVIQTRNRSADPWPRNSGLDYVANGEIGVVTGMTKGQKSEYLDIAFSTQPGVSYRYFRNEVNENLELAYALTVHKAQGSDFDSVFFIVPQSASTLSRELIYTGLTRFRKRLVLFLERDVAPLLRLRSPDASDTRLHNTFVFSLHLRPEDVKRPRLDTLIHRTRRGKAVRSKSEVIVADTLQSLGISYEYEDPLRSPTDPDDFRLPDFTVSFEGDVFYWEHLGMLSVPSYREAWERKRRWYENHGWLDRLITSEDRPDGGIDAAEIERIARGRILGE
ncbi:MAG: AAA family ATPase [Gemmatimonadetes bacterium]|nr:AAA family ATPase [Gemmatimonadota bacterium]MBA4157048.1 AAA family ATPase [Gemmatimonadota bacterium]